MQDNKPHNIKEYKQLQRHINENALTEEDILFYGANLDVNGQSTLESSWESVLEKITKRKEIKKPHRIQMRRALLVAASIALLIASTTIWVFVSKETLISSPGQHLSIVLPDNSEVMLNASSSIEYNKLLWNLQRKVHLDGEAYFKVTKGSNFKVQSKRATTQVLGTRFNVYARNTSYIVKCFSGLVQVESNNEDTKLLEAAEYIELKPSGSLSPIMQFDAHKEDWKQGVFRYKQQELQLVFDELARQFQVELNIKGNITGRQYTGLFKAGDLDLALQMVCTPMQLDYQISNNQVSIQKLTNN